MTLTLRVTLIVGIMIYFAYLFHMVRKRKFILRYALLWLFAGIVMLLTLIFPEGYERLIHFLGVAELTNGLFAMVLFAVLIIMLYITSIISKHNEDIRTLVQKIAIYEKRIRELEEKLNQQDF